MNEITSDYLSDLPPSDYLKFLFPNLKANISDEEVKAIGEGWINAKGSGFFSSGMMVLEHSWAKRIKLGSIWFDPPSCIMETRL